MSDKPSQATDSVTAKIRERASQDVGSESSDDLAKQEERRYATKQPSDDEPTMPAHTAKKLRLDDLNDYYSQRRKHIPRLFRGMVIWVVAVLGLVALSGFGPPFSADDHTDEGLGWFALIANWVFSFRLNDGVLIALVSGTTANIIGLFYVVAQYLYPKDKPPTPDGF
jgi:hypothetical protein